MERSRRGRETATDTSETNVSAADASQIRSTVSDLHTSAASGAAGKAGRRRATGDGVRTAGHETATRRRRTAVMGDTMSRSMQRLILVPITAAC